MAEERDIRIEDSQGNMYYPHGKAKTVFCKDGESVEEKIMGGRFGKIKIGQSEVCGSGSISIGLGAKAMTNTGMAIGFMTEARGELDAIAIGTNAKVDDGGISIGQYSHAKGKYSVVLGFGNADGDYSTAISGKAVNHHEGVLGGIGKEDTNKWIVPGSFTVEGTKNFEIPHPKPSKKETHRIRHGAVESPTAGDTLYRYKIKATKDNDLVTIDLPDYFIYLNKDVQIWVTPQGHFGNGYGELNRETEQLEIHCQYEGEYNVLVIGTRNDDHPSVQSWDIKGVEREIGESWTGETYVFEVEEILEVEEIKEV